jgi:hypothetical protein
MDNPFDVLCSDGAPRASEGDTITTDHALHNRTVEPIQNTIAKHRDLAETKAQLDCCAWLMDDPALFG